MLSKHKEKIDLQTRCYSPVLLRVKLDLILNDDIKKKNKMSNCKLKVSATGCPVTMVSPKAYQFT